MFWHFPLSYTFLKVIFLVILTVANDEHCLTDMSRSHVPGYPSPSLYPVKGCSLMKYSASGLSEANNDSEVIYE